MSSEENQLDEMHGLVLCRWVYRKVLISVVNFHQLFCGLLMLKVQCKVLLISVINFHQLVCGLLMLKSNVRC